MINEMLDNLPSSCLPAALEWRLDDFEDRDFVLTSMESCGILSAAHEDTVSPCSVCGLLFGIAPQAYACSKIERAHLSATQTCPLCSGQQKVRAPPPSL